MVGVSRNLNRAPYAGLNRIRFQGTFSMPFGIPLAAASKVVAVPGPVNGNA
jgi:hypothetical protein